MSILSKNKWNLLGQLDSNSVRVTHMDVSYKNNTFFFVYIHQVVMLKVSKFRTNRIFSVESLLNSKIKFQIQFTRMQGSKKIDRDLSHVRAKNSFEIIRNYGRKDDKSSGWITSSSVNVPRLSCTVETSQHVKYLSQVHEDRASCIISWATVNRSILGLHRWTLLTHLIRRWLTDVRDGWRTNR